VKKLVFIAALALVFSISGALSAQTSNAQAGSKEQSGSAVYDQSEYYYVNVPLVKVYAHKLGYKVVYKLNSTTIASNYLPMEWFLTYAGKGTIDYGPGMMFPYMTVYYKNGQFDHVRLHLNSDTNDPSWAIFDQTADVAPLFKKAAEEGIKIGQ
jgi:hypothetical protein